VATGLPAISCTKPKVRSISVTPRFPSVASRAGTHAAQVVYSKPSTGTTRSRAWPVIGRVLPPRPYVARFRGATCSLGGIMHDACHRSRTGRYVEHIDKDGHRSRWLTRLWGGHDSDFFLGGGLYPSMKELPSTSRSDGVHGSRTRTDMIWCRSEQGLHAPPAPERDQRTSVPPFTGAAVYQARELLGTLPRRVKERRGKEERPTNCLCHPSEDGNSFSEGEDIVNHMIFLMMPRMTPRHRPSTTMCLPPGPNPEGRVQLCRRRIRDRLGMGVWTSITGEAGCFDLVLHERIRCDTGQWALPRNCARPECWSNYLACGHRTSSRTLGYLACRDLDGSAEIRVRGEGGGVRKKSDRLHRARSEHKRHRSASLRFGSSGRCHKWASGDVRSCISRLSCPVCCAATRLDLPRRVPREGTTAACDPIGRHSDRVCAR